MLWQRIRQLTREQKRDWVALWNKPIWILLSSGHLVSLILWKVSILSLRARVEREEVSALDDNLLRGWSWKRKMNHPHAQMEGSVQRPGHIHQDRVPVSLTKTTKTSTLPFQGNFAGILKELLPKQNFLNSFTQIKFSSWKSCWLFFL